MRLSVFLPDCKYLLKPDERSRHGAFLATAAFFKWVANNKSFERLEVFLPPGMMAEGDTLVDAATQVLRPENMGKGRLSFYPVHHLPEVFADGVPRILRSLDPADMARDRYLRDAFAQGPTAMSVDTHIVGAHAAQRSLRDVAAARPVPYDSVQCISHSLRDALVCTLRSLGVEEPPFRLDVVQRPIDTSVFRPPTENEKYAARCALRIPTDGTVAMYHSRVGPFSKADLYPLVQAFAACSGPNDWLVVGGAPTSDTAYARLRDWLIEAGVRDRSRFLGSCAHDDVAIRLWAADFFVLPCDNPTEGLGVAPIEAMATGLPAVVSDWDGMREGVIDGENGFRVPTYWVEGSDRIGAFSPFINHLAESLLLAQCVVVDQEALADRMGRLFNDQALRTRLGTRARETALDFGADKIGPRLVELFESQLAEAAAESADEREARRADAQRLALPTQYGTILPGQATRTLRSDDVLEITAVGRGLVDGTQLVRLYEPVGKLAAFESLAATLELLRKGPQTVGTILKATGGAFQDGAYGISVLLKRGAVRLTPREP